MLKHGTENDQSLYDYLLSVSLREHPVLKELREETAKLPQAGLQLTPEQGQFLSLLARLLNAKKTLEVGVFTGYSSLSVALALPEDGQVIACDINEDWTAVAQRYWAAAGVDHKISLHLAPAGDTLKQLIAAGESGSFDLAFIDADKTNYDHYYEAALNLLRPGGLVVIDNVLWHGAVIDPNAQDPDTLAIRAINQKVQADDRVDISLVPIGDGLMLARKR